MSGFMQDIAGWALGGGAARANDEEATNNAAANEDETLPPVPMTPAELRAQRLARMEQQQQAAVPMEIDDAVSQDLDQEMKPSADEDANDVQSRNTDRTRTTTPNKPSVKIVPEEPSPMAIDQPPQEKPEKVSTPMDVQRRLQKKKELLLKKTLSVSLQEGNDDYVNTGSSDISVGSIAEIIATRLSLPPANTKVIPYLSAAFYHCIEEQKLLQNSKKPQSPELTEILREIQDQTVSYAATCLVEEDLFPAVSKDGFLQLAECLIRSVAPDSSMPFNIAQGANSFYSRLVQELDQQNPSKLKAMTEMILSFFMEKLKKCNSVLDTPADASALTVVSALNLLCANKTAAVIVTKLESFRIPASGSIEATQVIRPAMPMQSIELFLANAARPYMKRSGPGIEKHTILGQCLRIGLPKTNSTAFPVEQVLRQSVAASENIMTSHRRQLSAYQHACHQLTMTLLKAGVSARQTLMGWMTDALLVNNGASATRPDSSKVSSESFRLNLTMLFLKLCQPFLGDAKKQHLIHPGFVNADQHHGGVFAITGDDAVPRLGEPKESLYDPKNEFIPFCFFFCARSLHFSIASILSQHEHLLRNIAHFHHELTSRNRDIHSDLRFASLISRQRSEEVALFQEELCDSTLQFNDFLAKILLEMPDDSLSNMPEEFVSDCCSIMLGIAQMKPKRLQGINFRHLFHLVVKLLSGPYANMVRNYNLRAQLGDVLYELFLPHSRRGEDVPPSVWTDELAGGQTYLLSSREAQETLAPSLLLLYGEVEHTGYYDKMSHRAKISSLIKYLWESVEHRPAFKRITQDKSSFLKFANGIMNETNTLIATVMQKLPEIRESQLLMANSEEWNRLSEDEQNQVSSRLEDNERDVKSSLPLCNKTLQMFGYLNTDEDIRALFLLDELCNRLVSMLLHVLTKLVGSKGLELKVDNPEQYDFRPKEMLRDLCAIFSLFASSPKFQEECARTGGDPKLIQAAAKTCRRLNLLTGESLKAFEELPVMVDAIKKTVAEEEQLYAGAPDEFLDELLYTFMRDPVRLPSNHVVDRSHITQHLLNDPTDPFSRAPLTVDQLVPDVELKKRMESWLAEKRESSKIPENRG